MPYPIIFPFRKCLCWVVSSRQCLRWKREKARVWKQNLGSIQVQLRAKIKMNYYQLWLLDRQAEVQQRTISLLNELAQKYAITRDDKPHASGRSLLRYTAEVASEKSKLHEMYSKRGKPAKCG